MIEIDKILDVENQPEGIEAVIFDLDDTLYSEKEYVRSGYHQIAEHFHRPELEDELWQAFLEKKPAIDAVIPEHKDEALRIYREQKPDVHLYSGVRDMLTRLHKHYKLGLITDGRTEGQKAKIDTLGIRDYFDEIIITDELGGIEYRKPCDKAFHIMLEKLGVEPARAVYIGDNVDKDFIAPEKLGMKSIWFRNADSLYQKIKIDEIENE